MNRDDQSKGKMSKLVLISEGFTEAVDAAKEFYELYKKTVVFGGIPMEQLRFVAALKVFDSMLNAAPQTDAQPVGKFAKFTDGVWREVTKGSAGVPLYEHPPTADVAELVEALRRLEEVASDCDIGYMDNAVRYARAVLDKWEGK